MLVQLVRTGQVMLWCMSRGSATESPAGHLISRHGPRTSPSFSQETGPQVPGSSLHWFVPKMGGSSAGTQGFALEQHPLPAGKGAHILQLPGNWEKKWLMAGSLSFMWRNIWVSSLPGAMEMRKRTVGRVLGSSLQLRAPAGPLLLAVLGGRLSQALGR